MPRRFSIAGLLLAGAAATQAAETEYMFQWTGFAELSPMGELVAWYPTITLAGTFRGEDRNNDSVITQAEISSLHVTGHGPDFVAGCPPGGIGVAGPSDCHLSDFSYAIGGGLTFLAAYQISNDGDTYHWFNIWPPYFMRWEPAHLGDGYEYYMTDDTVFQISAVPEPASWAMLLGGLGLVGAAMRKRASA